MNLTEILILAGAFAGGFVSGLTGFGTGLTALPFWLNAVHPAIAAPLVVGCSIVAQVQTLPAIWHAISWRRVAPFVFGGLIGVPVGTMSLSLLSPLVFRLSTGVFLVAYCGFMLARSSIPVVDRGGRLADAAVGFAGGILGGLAGLSGALPTLWASLRGWSKDMKRGVFQVFNLSILGFALVALLIGGFLTGEVGSYILIALPGTLVGAWLGRKIYNRLKDDRFDQVVLVFLLLSGLSIIATTDFG